MKAFRLLVHCHNSLPGTPKKYSFVNWSTKVPSLEIWHCEGRKRTILPPFSFDKPISKTKMFSNDNPICYWHGLWQYIALETRSSQLKYWRTNKKIYIAFIRLISTLGALGHCDIWKYIYQNWMEGVSSKLPARRSW